MTYLELIETTLKFIKDNDLDPSYYDLWYDGDPKLINHQQKKEVVLGLMYLAMIELQSNGMKVNGVMLSKIEDQLTVYETDVIGTIIKATTTASDKVWSDLDTLEMLDSIDNEEDTEEREKLLGKIYKNVAKTVMENMAQNVQRTVAEYPINNLIRNTVTALPELLFTQTGQKYLPKGFIVGGQGMNAKCNSILRHMLVIHQMKEENNYLNGYNSLYYSVKAASIISDLARKGNYTGLKRLTAIDDFIDIIESDRIERSMYQAEDTDIKSALELIYQTKNKGFFYLTEQVLLSDSQDQDKDKDKEDEFLDFILSDPTIKETFSIGDISLILLDYYDSKEENPKASLQENMPSIKRILGSTSNLYQKRRQLSHLAEKKSAGPKLVKK